MQEKEREVHLAPRKIEHIACENKKKKKDMQCRLEMSLSSIPDEGKENEIEKQIERER